MSKVFERMPLDELILLVEQKKAEPKTTERHAAIIGRHIAEMERIIQIRQAREKDNAGKA